MEIEALVFKRGGRTREGRGFSKGELRRVELDFGAALRMGLRVDKRRRSVHEENVRLLEEFLRGLRAERKALSGGAVKKVEKAGKS